ncbi:MAG: hypothetical protein V3V13_00020 [Paracoccaceae bacterium]
MLGWIKRKVLEQDTNAAKTDLEKYIRILKGMSDEEIGDFLIPATISRTITYKHLLIAGALDLRVLRNAELETVPLRLNRQIRECQKRETFEEAAALMPWLHSVRSINDLELRYLSKEMWAELIRGFPHARSSIGFFQSSNDVNIPNGFLESMYFVPYGLEPKGFNLEQYYSVEENHAPSGYRAKVISALATISNTKIDTQNETQFCIAAATEFVTAVNKSLKVAAKKLDGQKKLTLGIFIFTVSDHLSHVLSEPFESVSTITALNILGDDYAENITLTGELFNDLGRTGGYVQGIGQLFARWINNPTEEDFKELAVLSSLNVGKS